MITKAAALIVFGPGAPQGSGPSGAPFGLGAQSIPGATRLTWGNGDAAAYTRVYRRSTNCDAGGETLELTVNPGQTWAHVGSPVSGWALRHYKNGQESAASNCVTG